MTRARSPCLNCDQLYESKSRCCMECEPLDQWRIDERLNLFRPSIPVDKVPFYKIRQGPSVLKYFNVPRHPKPKLRIPAYE
jgi:hypothetical protein